VEAELEAEQRRGRDVIAENRKLARLLQELRAQSEEDHRLATELQDTVNTLTLKINTLKRQLLEAVSARAAAAAAAASRRLRHFVCLRVCLVKLEFHDADTDADPDTGTYSRGSSPTRPTRAIS